MGCDSTIPTCTIDQSNLWFIQSPLIASLSMNNYIMLSHSSGIILKYLNGALLEKSYALYASSWQ